MRDTEDQVEQEDQAEPDLGILPRSSTPPSSLGGHTSHEEVTRSSDNGRTSAESVQKEWLLIRLGHRLCGFRGRT